MGWNPWHGCHRISEGCRNCFVFAADKRYGRNTELFTVNKEFSKPSKKNSKGIYTFFEQPYVFTCSNSDFFLEEADSVRDAAWSIIRERYDLNFLIPTKRIERINQCLPTDWRGNFNNVYISCTIENQAAADIRLPIYTALELPHYLIQAEPLLGPLDIADFLVKVRFEKITVEGEFGPNARECRYEWVKQLRDQCVQNNVTMIFRRTGDKFIDCNGTLTPRRARGMQEPNDKNLSYISENKCCNLL